MNGIYLDSQGVNQENHARQKYRNQNQKSGSLTLHNYHVLCSVTF